MHNSYEMYECNANATPTRPLSCNHACGPVRFLLTGAVRSWHCPNIWSIPWIYTIHGLPDRGTAHWPRYATESSQDSRCLVSEESRHWVANSGHIGLPSHPYSPKDSYLNLLFRIHPDLLPLSPTSSLIPLSTTHDVWTYNVLILSQKNYNFIKTHPT